MSPSVRPGVRNLPFHQGGFGWSTFEDFFCDFLAAGPVLNLNGKPIRVHSARPYGRKGDKQDGIDIRAEMEGGKVWAFQCKHHKNWSDKKTRDAVAACTYPADRKILLVTCEVSEEARKSLPSHDWELWDAKQISQEFLSRLPGIEAARILYTSFGSGWAEEMLNLPGSSPLISADAFFLPLLEKQRTFHHRLPLVGRKAELKSLDAFVEDPHQRVYFLQADGGQGKSRLLLEWSKYAGGFNARHPGCTLRFIDKDPGDSAPFLDASRRPLVLVLDDAHRKETTVAELLKEIARRRDVKLVVALRPTAISQVKLHSLRAGVDISELATPPPLTKLTHDEALQLVDEAFGANRPAHERQSLAKLCRDCPMMAPVAASMLQKGSLSRTKLLEDPVVETLIFEGLLEDAQPTMAKYGEVAVRDFLRLIALLSPVNADESFRSSARKFLGLNRPHLLLDILDSLKSTGLLRDASRGLQVVPDLLSDHLVYSACYDKDGKDKGFATEVFEHFPGIRLDCLLRHLAEAEWIARAKGGQGDSVIEPLWQELIKAFNSSNFLTRQNLIAQWTNIAAIQPERSLELARLALTSSHSTSDLDPSVKFAEEFNTHREVVLRAATMLKLVAESHTDYCLRVLDLLWEMGCTLELPDRQEETHPMSVIAQIAAYAPWKDLQISNLCLDWTEQKLKNSEWLNCQVPPRWILREFVRPFFATAAEFTWSSSLAIHVESSAVPIKKTANMRARALELCRWMMDQNSTQLALYALDALAPGIEPAKLGLGADPSAAYQKAWLKERRKALALVREILFAYPDAAVAFAVRSTLHWPALHDPVSSFQTACMEILISMAETFKLRVLTATLGTVFQELELRHQGDPSWNHQNWESKVESFYATVATDTLQEWPSAASWLGAGAQWLDEQRDYGYEMNFRPIMSRIAANASTRALEIADLLIQQPSHPLSQDVDILIFGATRNDHPTRLAYCQKALAANSESLAVAVAQCFRWWRMAEALPSEAWGMLLDLAKNDSERIVAHVLEVVSAGEDHPLPEDWNVLSTIPNVGGRRAIAEKIVTLAARMASHECPPEWEVVTNILEHFVNVPEVEGPKIATALRRLVEVYPGEMFQFLWNRRHKIGLMVHIQLKDLLDERIFEFPAFQVILPDLLAKVTNGPALDWDESSLLQRFLLSRHSDAAGERRNLLTALSTADAVARLVEALTSPPSTTAALVQPEFVGQLLAKARNIGWECHQKAFMDLRLLKGTRSSINGEPSAEWQSLVEHVERLAHKYARDRELGPLFAEAAKMERARIAEQRRSFTRHLEE